MNSPDSAKSICSPAAASGPSPQGSPDGLTTDLFGQPLVPASRSRGRASKAVSMIQGICGRTYIDSPVPAGPLLSWENRLRERLAMVGSTESALIWRAKATPAGQSISRLAPSTRHTNGTGNTGRQWSTSRATDGEKGGPNMKFGAGGQPLPAQIHQAAHWITASARDHKDSAGMATAAGDRSRIDQLPRQMVANAYHPTPLALSFKEIHQPGNNASIQKMREYMPDETAPTGQIPSGSTAMTEKRGAPNPVFAFWLMGFPAEWISGALAAMQSFRKPRRRRSAR